MKSNILRLIFLFLSLCIFNSQCTSASNHNDKEIANESTEAIDLSIDSPTTAVVEGNNDIDGITTDDYSESENETEISDADDVDNENEAIGDVVIDEEPDEFLYDEIRLPKTVIPKAYRLDFATSLKNLTFGGIAEIDIEVLEDTSYIIVHNLNLDLSGFVLSNQSNTKTWVPEFVQLNKEKQYVIIVFNEELIKGNYTLKIKYDGKLVEGLDGYYLSKYNDDDGKVTYLATTQFEATYARAAFPCFDEPGFKATFQLNMTIEEGYNAISNMNVVRIEDIPGSTDKKYIFDKSVKMSTYLVAFVVSKFVSVSSEEDGFTLSVYSRPEQIKNAQLALTSASKILRFYEKIYDIPYPLHKLDLVAIPDFEAYAMENWGIITFRETGILYDESKPSFHAAEEIVNTIAHELVHQWFGNLVTMKWWDDLWLNEGFADFMAYKGIDIAKPEWKAGDHWFIDDVIDVFTTDATNHTHAIYSKVNNPDEIWNLFDHITYYKGNSVIRMIESWLNTLAGNDENTDIKETYFFKKIQLYLKTNKFSNAETEELWEALESYDEEGNALIGVSKTMNGFIKQEGYPIVMMNKAINDNSTISLTQERYFLNRLQLLKENQPKDETKWTIPFSYMVFSNATGKPELVETKSIILEDKSEIHLSDLVEKQDDNASIFVKGNFNQNGYYKVQYDDDDIKTACEWLKTDLHFMEPIDRAGFLHDIGTQLFTGRTDNPEMILDCFNFLKKERSYVVWATGNDVLSFLLRHFNHFKDEAVVKKAHNFIASLIEEIYEEIGWGEKKGANTAAVVEDNTLHNRSKLRNSIIALATALQLEKTKEEGLNYFNQIKNGTYKENFDDDTLKYVYAAGVMYGDEKDFDYVYDRYLKESYANRKESLMYALTYVKDEAVKPKIFEIGTSGNIRSNDLFSFYRSFASKKENTQLSWNFIKENYASIVEDAQNAASNISKVLAAIAENIDEEYLDEIVSWFLDESDPLKESFKYYKTNVLLGYEKGKSCIYWIENENLGGAIVKYLNEKF